MIHPDDPLTMRFPRSAREAFGTNYYEERQECEWLWFFGTVVVVLVAAVAVVWWRSK